MNLILFANNYVEQPDICAGCSRWVGVAGATGRCTTYRVPAIRSYERRGGCPFNQKVVASETKKVNPLKASKRSRKKK